MFTPTFGSGTDYYMLVIAIIGTTITPWMQFYQQALVVDKGLGHKDLHYVKIDTYLGAIMTDVFSLFMIVACAATLYPAGIKIESAAEAAIALRPFAGKYASVLFAVGLLNASTMAASVLPISTAHAISEAFGFESSIGSKFRDAPVFMGLYTFFLMTGMAILAFPGANLVKVMLFSQTVNGILLPVILIAMLRLVNDKRVVGEHVNGPVANAIAWAQAIVLILLTVVLLYSSVATR
jgi:Mn2+/Fe2+ NRAMP family transporter